MHKVTLGYIESKAGQYRDNLNYWLLKASTENVYKGINWYQNAHYIAQVIADKYNLELMQSVAIIAALSPRVHWVKNMIDATSIAEFGADCTVSTYNRNKQNAVNARVSDNPLSFINGNKTSAFADNIAYPTTSDMVTCDTHATRIMIERTESPDRPIDGSYAVKFISSPKKYALVSQVYRSVAYENAYLPLHLQAILWYCYRDAIGIVDDNLLELYASHWIVQYWLTLPGN